MARRWARPTALHQRIKSDTQLNCSIGIGSLAFDCESFLGQSQAAWNPLGHSRARRRSFSPRSTCAISQVWEKLRSKTCRPWAFGGSAISLASTMGFSQEHFGKWGLALAGKARGEDAGGWFDTEVGADTDPKSISHEHTYNEDTADPEQIESTLMRLSEMVGRRLREDGLHARTIQLKLRYKDFTTITRAHSLPAPTQLDTEIFEQVRALFRKNWRKGTQVRLLGVHASSFQGESQQEDLLEGARRQRWQQALSAADRLRDKFGESSVSLASGLKGGFRERTHENPAGLPGKGKAQE